ncbi:hypothetical protein C1646_710440 [Rhizophagus diaphanus]|nr:hypothetical protein C1646_710440 [Rhizophagus diaphanus] [Rhizophagus sp. MUCL 43196]
MYINMRFQFNFYSFCIKFFLFFSFLKKKKKFKQKSGAINCLYLVPFVTSISLYYVIFFNQCLLYLMIS